MYDNSPNISDVPKSFVVISINRLKRSVLHTLCQVQCSEFRIFPIICLWYTCEYYNKQPINYKTFTDWSL